MIKKMRKIMDQILTVLSIIRHFKLSSIVLSISRNSLILVLILIMPLFLSKVWQKRYQGMISKEFYRKMKSRDGRLLSCLIHSRRLDLQEIVGFNFIQKKIVNKLKLHLMDLY